MNLAERIASRSARNLASGEPTSRARYWVRTYLNGRDGDLRRHLGLFGLDLHSGVLGDPIPEPFRRPTWVDACESLFPELDDRSRDRPTARAAAGSDDTSAYEMLRPLLDWGEACVRQRIDATDLAALRIADTAALLQSFRQALGVRLLRMAMPTLVLLANLRGMSLLDTASTVRAVARGQPVLLRQLYVATEAATAAANELFRRLAADRDRLDAAFGIPRRAKLRNIQWLRGDTHRRGRSVCIIEFDARTLIYKPRSVEPEQLFSDVLSTAASRAPHPIPEPFDTLCRGDYGYCEPISPRDCCDRTEVADAFFRLGGLLALGWLLGMTDMHSENIIMRGGLPFLVDAETILWKPPAFERTSRISAEVMAVQDLLCGTSLLPDRRMGQAGAYDLSGLSVPGRAGKPFEDVVLKVQGGVPKLRTDRIELGETWNLPRLAGEPVAPESHVADLVLGYRSTVEWLARDCQTLDAIERHVAVAGDVRCRWVPRPTSFYFELLARSWHPSVLAHALDVDMLYARLWSHLNWIPRIEELIPLEIADLWRSDIPVFETRAASLDLEGADGRVIPGFFRWTGADEFRRRRRMLPRMAAKHEDVIRATVMSAAPPIPTPPDPAEDNPFANTLQLDPDKILSRVFEIAEELVAACHMVDGLPFWAGPTVIGEADYAGRILPPTVYEGAPGIGVFLAAWGRVSGNAAAIETAAAVRRMIHATFAEQKKWDCGVFDGSAGLVWADVLISGFLAESSSNRIPGVLQAIAAATEGDRTFDIMGGAAGVLVLSKRLCDLGLDEAEGAARAAAAALKRSAERVPAGVTWPTRGIEAARLGGMSHGASGIGMALSLWAEDQCDEEARALAVGAFDYEEGLWDPVAATWRDARKDQSREVDCYWCHGAAGIGLAASVAGHALGRERTAAMLERAVEASLRYGFRTSHCLCHGSVGNAEVFRRAGRCSEADTALAATLACRDREGRWRSGVAGYLKSPSLMVGSAGVGLGLLRHLYTDRIPDLLTVEL